VRGIETEIFLNKAKSPQYHRLSQKDKEGISLVFPIFFGIEFFQY